MRQPRFRLTVRMTMLFIAIVALGLFVVEEFSDGMPPRFVIRGIPSRINRLRPGMSWEETRDILGFERAWFKGGTNATFGHGEGNGGYMHEVYYIRSPRLVMGTSSVNGGAPQPTGFLQSEAMIQVWFSTKMQSGFEDWRTKETSRLTRASFSSDRTLIAEMPR
jgi:hypothetical protein